MANTKISQLTALTNPTWNEEFVYALNNANGKVTLDTMKTYTQTWTQEELVSWTNIKTINGNSILGSWNLVISWWGWAWEDNDYDAVVDANGGWDYTSISDAITAGIKRIYVRNWTYSMSSQTLSTWDFKLVWESKEWVQINITYPTRSWTIFTMTSNTTDTSHSFLITNVTFNITYSWEYWYFILFNIPTNWVLTVNDCNIRVVSATNGCNFYLTDRSWGWMIVNWSYIEVFPTTWTPSWVWFLWGISTMEVNESTIVVDADSSIWTTWLTFDWNCGWTYNWCIFKIWVSHNTVWDIANMWGWHADSCTYSTSGKANIRIYGEQVNCSFPTIWDSATYDTALATAVAWNNITIWKPSTSYSVWDYVQSWHLLTLARCKTAHTSWATFDNSKRDAVYWDIYITWDLNDCTLGIKWIAVMSWVAQYSTAFTLPATMSTMSETTFIVYNNSSLTTNGLVILWYRWLTNSRIEANYNYKWWIKILMPSECSMFANNRIISYTWSIYSSWKANMITNNIWTYVTWQTAPTATQVAWWGSTIDNNIFYDVADWDN